MVWSKKQRPSAATAATVVGGKAARACDSCVCRRALWYCAADDAFLCQSCDSSVHSANPLARRHHRVRLRIDPASEPEKLAPAWHHGFKRKARTPRRPPKAKTGGGAPPFVPEIDEDGSNELEEQLLYRVPIFDPALAAGFVQSDAEIAEFEAEMESLLGRGPDADSFSMEELGLADTKYSMPEESGRVKEEVDNEGRKIGLTLDYEAIADRWSATGCLSPWMDGERPRRGPDDCWLDIMCGMRGGGEAQGLVAGETGGGHLDEGREARVSRYREKRRTRLFSKKIRYEVRKLNAEKRPRMKGRFVKRASFAPASDSPAFRDENGRHQSPIELPLEHVTSSLQIFH